MYYLLKFIVANAYANGRAPLGGGMFVYEDLIHRPINPNLPSKQIVQKVDHFNPNDNRVFNQRYMEKYVVIFKKVYRIENTPSYLEYINMLQNIAAFVFSRTEIFVNIFHFSMTFYIDGGPAFLIIQGEGYMWDQWVQSSGPYKEWAKEQKGAMFTLEHRYYGNSQPGQDYTWLSSRL